MNDIPKNASREDFPFWYDMATRWNDNDQLGHVNNVVYYSYFEACVVNFVQTECDNDWMKSPCIPYAAETSCRFLRPVAFPSHLNVGLNITHIGRTSVKYSLALFVEGEAEASATSEWIHVWVDRNEERPVPIPEVAMNAYTRHKK
ncbi:MAG: acyl-CoA thioesterase [Rhodospirillales bacterium]|nr:acyl-CoA thioesterase [Rhodospirillales bacterium]